MILETVVTHGSDYIEWVDGSGHAGGSLKVVSPTGLLLSLSKAPGDLEVDHRARLSVLRRKRPRALSAVFPGMPSEDRLKRPEQGIYVVKGRVVDPSGTYLPRQFSLQCGGSSAGHRVSLFRSPMGSRFSSAGGLIGRAVSGDGAVAPWALIHLQVTPPLGGSLAFVAQADRHGEFVLPLDRIPALPVDALSKTYAAVLSVRGLPGAKPAQVADPDSFTDFQIASGPGDEDGFEFSPELTLQITPGAVSRVTSPGQAHLILKPN